MLPLVNLVVEGLFDFFATGAGFEFLSSQIAKLLRTTWRSVTTFELIPTLSGSTAT